MSSSQQAAAPERRAVTKRRAVTERRAVTDRLASLACVLVPTALSAVLVLHDLGTRSLWVDEGATFSYASQHGSALWYAITRDGGNMLAYYAGMHVVIGLFGSSPEVLRLPSALATIATVPVCFALVRRLFDRRAATLSALMVAGSLPLVYWGQTARAYSFGVLLVAASTLAFVLALQTGARSAWVCYCILAALAVSTILLTVLAVVAQYCALALRRRGDLPLVRLALCAGAIGVLSIPVTVIAVAHGSAQLGWFRATGPPFDATNRYLFRFLASAQQGGLPTTGQEHILADLMLAVWVLAGVLFVACLARRRRSDESFAWGILVATFVLPALATYAISELIHPALSDRYLLSTVAPASMLAGVACSRIRPAPAAWLAGLALVGLRVAQIPPSYGVSMENWQAASSFVLDGARPTDCAAFFVADGYPVFDYYVLRQRSAHHSVPDPVLPSTPWSTRQPYELDPATFPPASLPRVVASCPRLWLVLTHQAGHAPGPGVPAYQVRKQRAYNLLMRQLRPRYRPESQRVFAGVAVVLYVRR